MPLKRFKIFLVTVGGLVGGAIFAVSSAGAAEPLDLVHVPLAASEPIPPNLMVTLDDSGSMERGYMPNSVGSLVFGGRAYKASSDNRLAYNPEVTYTPGVDSSGVEFPDADFEAATLVGVSGNNRRGIYVFLHNIISAHNLTMRRIRLQPANTSTILS
ncbi:MAG: hypothetical protein COB04_19450, partial [Gammaproteobacteria bacterium]